MINWKSTQTKQIHYAISIIGLVKIGIPAGTIQEILIKLAVWYYKGQYGGHIV